MGKIVSGQKWVYVLIGDVPPDVTPENLKTAILRGVSTNGEVGSIVRGLTVSVDQGVVTEVARLTGYVSPSPLALHREG